MVRFLLEYTCATQDAESAKEVVVVNPDAAVSQRIASLLGCSTQSYKTVEEFARTLTVT
jgi:hypothetical protein